MDLGVSLESEDCVRFVHEAFVAFCKVDKVGGRFGYFADVEFRCSLMRR